MSSASFSAHPRLSLNQATIKYASLSEAVALAASAGLESIGLWREPVAEAGLSLAASILSDSGLRLSSLCRGGFLTASDLRAQREAHEDNLAAIDECAALAAAGAQGSSATLVLVVGGIPTGSTDLVAAREQVRDPIEALAPHAADVGVTLAIEPLHPMYASDRAVVSTLGQALDIAEDFAPEVVGVVVDTFHVWWDPQLRAQIARAGAGGRIASYQVCDWATPLPPDVLLARHYPGEGVIDFRWITEEIVCAGYRGDIEVEIFNQSIWDAPGEQVVQRTVSSFNTFVAPHI